MWPSYGIHHLLMFCSPLPANSSGNYADLVLWNFFISMTLPPGLQAWSANGMHCRSRMQSSAGVALAFPNLSCFTQSCIVTCLLLWTPGQELWHEVGRVRRPIPHSLLLAPLWRPGHLRGDFEAEAYRRLQEPTPS